MKKFIYFILMFFITLSIYSQEEDYFPGSVKIGNIPVGTKLDSLVLADKNGLLKHLPQSTLLDRAELQIQPKLDLKADLADVNSHILNTNNPHSVTKAQVGLSNVDNTSDANKPISTATQSALDTKINNSEKAAPNGVATLEVDGKIPMSQIPDALIGAVNYVGLWDANSNSPVLVSPTDSSTKGQYYIVNVAGTRFGITYKLGDYVISDGNTWGKVDNNNAVDNVFGRKGSVTALEGDYQSFYPRLSFSYNDPSWIASLDYGKIINTPTTLSGYGITDVYTKTESESRYVNVTGDTMTGDLTAPNFIGDWNGYSEDSVVKFLGNEDLDSPTSNNITWSSLNTPIGISAQSFTFGRQDGAYLCQILSRNDRIYFRNVENGALTDLRELYHTGNFTPTNYLNKTTGGTITGTTLYDKTIAEQESASVKTVVNREFVEDYVANNAPTPDLSNYVDRTTSQTISGAKTFTGKITIDPVGVFDFLEIQDSGLRYKKSLLSNVTVNGYGGMFVNADSNIQFFTPKDTNNTNFILNTTGWAGKRTYDLPDANGELLLKNGDGSQLNNVEAASLKNEGLTFANLPASPSIGDIATITDAGSVTYRGVASGGGSNVALVMYDGTNWIYH